nr:helix-turn-helix domain-containing protein [Selenomonas sp. oral taxon 136]
MEQNHCTTRTGKWKQLTELDRYKIEAYFQAGLKPQEIAAYIGCSKRTIERERRLGMTAQLSNLQQRISRPAETCRCSGGILPMQHKGDTRKTLLVKGGG